MMSLNALRRAVRRERFGVVPAVLLGFSAACGADPAEVSQELAAQHAKSVAASSSMSQQVEVPKLDELILYIDASRSMAGFAQCRATPTEYSATLDRLSSDLGIVEAIRFGERRSGDGASFERVGLNRDVHCNPFYDRMQNPDYELYQRAAEDTTDAVHIYFTDGVQSDWRGANPGPSLAALKQHVEGGRGFAIIAFKSGCSGQAWSEQLQQMLPRVRVGSRPFYVFLLSRTDAQIDAVLRRISPALLSSGALIRLPSTPLDCQAGLLPRFDRLDDRTNPPWVMIELSEQTSSNAMVTYRCLLVPEYPTDIIRPRVLSTYLGWDNAQFVEEKAPQTISPLRLDSAAAERSNSVVTLIPTLISDRRYSHGLYLLTFEPEAGALRQEISQLSTDTDGTSDTFDKTYRFSWLLDHLLRSNIARPAQSKAPYAITVKY